MSRKRLVPLIREKTPILDKIREKKGGGLDTGIRGRVRFIPDMLLKQREGTSTTTKRSKTKSKKKAVNPKKAKKKVGKSKVSKPKKKASASKPKKKKTKGKTKKNPPKLVRQYAQEMAKTTGLPYQQVLNSSPVQNYWERMLE